MEFEHDGEAWMELRENFRDDRGCIKPKNKGYEPDRDEIDAINYLCAEWDYGYEP